MKITNKTGLPVQILKQAQKKEHKQGDYSVTQLLKGTCEIVLNKVHNEDLEYDCSETVNALLGTAVHKILEENDVVNCENELYMEAEFSGGITVSGTADVVDYETATIKDYKTCSVYKVLFRDYEDWCKQLKYYCYLLYRTKGELFTHAEIIALIKDFSPRDCEIKADYPKSQIVKIGFIFTEAEVLAVENEIDNKIRLCENAKREYLTTGVLEPCTADERWEKSAKFAVIKKGNKTATKLCDTREEAEKYIAEKDLKADIVERKGESTKCKNYCVAGKCGKCAYYNKIYGVAENDSQNQ